MGSGSSLYARQARRGGTKPALGTARTASMTRGSPTPAAATARTSCSGSLTAPIMPGSYDRIPTKDLFGWYTLVWTYVMVSSLRCPSQQLAEHPAEHLDAALIQDSVFFDDLQILWDTEFAEPSGRGTGAHHTLDFAESGKHFFRLLVYVDLDEVQMVEARPFDRTREILHARAAPAHDPDRSPRRKLHQHLQALQRRLGQQRDRLYPVRLHKVLHLVDVEERRHGESPRQVYSARDPVGEVLEQNSLYLDRELFLELGGELIQLRPRALDEEDGSLLLRLRTGPCEQRVRQIFDRHALRRREVHNPLHNLLTTQVLRLHRWLYHVDATAAAALHVTLPLEVGEHPRHRVPVHS